MKGRERTPIGGDPLFLSERFALWSMRKRSTRRSPGRITAAKPNAREYTPSYSIRDLHQLLDVVIAHGGREAVETYLENWLCSHAESGLETID